MFTHFPACLKRYCYSFGLQLCLNLSAALNGLALSDTIRLDIPLLAENLRRQHKNVFADKSPTSSKCIALVTQQENNAI
jgi:hypothetical protein